MSDEPIRPLINPDGSSFGADIASVLQRLSDLPNDRRREFRDQNASLVASHEASRILVVAGPGSGKSFLFLARIRYWLPLHRDAEIYVASFVRKLVVDLQGDINKASGLDAADRRRVTVTTLHQLARSLLERNGGTSAQPMHKHIRVIAPPWDVVVFEDVLLFETNVPTESFSLRRLHDQLHNDQPIEDEGWQRVRGRYAQLSQFYNAVGFPDMIALARDAVVENSELNSYQLWIIDEYQDFNASEDALVRALTGTALGVMLAGDDEQALYQRLKASHPEIIISYYDDAGFANAMLPYCSRCSYHVCLAASEFIVAHRLDSSIEKVYLPLAVELDAPKVQVVGTAEPSGVVDYIRRFLSTHEAELNAYVEKMEGGEESDPFLLILSPDRAASFLRYRDADQQLHSLIAQWAVIGTGHSFDYRRVATYFGSAGDASDNLALRKVLYHEGLGPEEVHGLIEEALLRGCPLSEVDSDLIRGAVQKCRDISAVLVSEAISPLDQAEQLSQLMPIDDAQHLATELAEDSIGQGRASAEDEFELAQPGSVTSLQPVELLTMVGAKGLSAQHVVIIGCDDVNMQYVSSLTFFVALTRARRSLHLLVSMKARGNEPHPFLFDLPAEHCEHRWFKKSDGCCEALGGPQGFKRKFGQLARAAARSSGDKRPR